MTAARHELRDDPPGPEVPPPFQRPPVRPRPRFEASIDLVALPSAVTVARLFVASTLRRWGAVFVEPEMVSITAELVALAVDVTGPGTDDLSEVGLLNPIAVNLVGYDRHLLVEAVHLQLPEVSTSVPRDLAVVNGLARKWGAYPTSWERVVWAELDLFGRDAAVLPQRVHEPGRGLRTASRSRGPSRWPTIDCVGRPEAV
ncbi:hypothetical protein [Amycolatopsis sp. NPDC059657]|uniref:hypothetical protein n=1 Tax=Amycolatopsis sp. NPDC059657 TaxID=3346899 RepID=UPI00366E85EF